MKNANKTAITKCCQCGKPFSFDPSKPQTKCKECLEKVKKHFATFTCKDCGKSFYVTVGEKDYFKEHNLELPKRCFDCRKIRKEERAKLGQKSQ